MTQIWPGPGIGRSRIWPGPGPGIFLKYGNFVKLVVSVLISTPSIGLLNTRLALVIVYKRYS